MVLVSSFLPLEGDCSNRELEVVSDGALVVTPICLVLKEEDAFCMCVCSDCL